MKRLCPLENNSIHHIYTKSIYRFEIFTCSHEYQRMLQLIQFYKYDGHIEPFSCFIEKIESSKKNFLALLTETTRQKTPLVQILAYCLMPTHIHFVLKQTADKGIEKFIGRSLNAYSRYFNLRHNRRGPLWENRFGNRLIADEADLNRILAYVHNNPVKDNLAKTAEEWRYSSANLPNPGGWEG